MGIDAARYRNDGSVGIAIGNFANEMTALYVAQNQPLLFSDEAITEGVGPASRLLLKFGCSFLITISMAGWTCSLPMAIWNRRSAKSKRARLTRSPRSCSGTRATERRLLCVRPSRESGEGLFKPIVGRGLAFADIDGDGDLDVVLTQTGGAPLLLRNDQELHHHWLRLKLVGTKSNRDAIGAWIKVRVNGRPVSAGDAHAGISFAIRTAGHHRPGYGDETGCG